MSCIFFVRNVFLGIFPFVVLFGWQDSLLLGPVALRGSAQSFSKSLA